MSFLSLFRKNLFLLLASSFLLFTSLASSAFAHHPFGIGDGSKLSVMQAFFSGIGHLLLGPDHLLFMLGLILVGIKRTKKSLLLLLLVGLAGSAYVQVQPLPDLLAPWAEALVSLSLALEGLIVLNCLSSKWLFPMFALHGYLLGNTIVGAEATPLAGYFLGLLLAQGSLLILATFLSQKVLKRFDLKSRNLFAGVWIGIGLAFSWVAFIA